MIKINRDRLFSVTLIAVVRWVMFFLGHLRTAASLWCVSIDEEFMVSLIIAKRGVKGGG